MVSVTSYNIIFKTAIGLVYYSNVTAMQWHFVYSVSLRQYQTEWVQLLPHPASIFIYCSYGSQVTFKTINQTGAS